MADHGKSANLSFRLALCEGPEFRSVDLVLLPDGTIDLSAQDIGPTAKATFGDSDYEFGVRIAPEDAPRLAIALLAEFLLGDLEAVDKVRQLAKKNGINPHFWMWP